VDKTKQGPLPQDPKQKQADITTKREEPRFVQGTVEPTKKK
jgi:hypothetical protein